MPALDEDFERGRLRKRYNLPSRGAAAIKPYRYDLIDFRTNKIRLPGTTSRDYDGYTLPTARGSVYVSRP